MPDPAAPNDKGELGGGLSYDIAKWQLDDQADRFRAIHARLSVTAGLNSVIIGLFAIAFAILARDPAAPELALAAITMFVFLVSVGCTTAALQTRRSRRGPTGSEVLRVERDVGEVLARRWAAEELSRAYDLNEPAIIRMERWARAAQFSAFVDAAFAVATVLAALFA